MRPSGIGASHNFLSTSLVLLFLVIVTHLPLAIADQDADKQALHDFGAAIPHLPKLNWNSSTPMCTAWVGINCTDDGSRVRAFSR